MIPPSCHSNGFSDIYGTGQKVCNMDVGEVAFTNHPGGTGTDTPVDKRGWRAWKTTFGMNVEASKAMIATEEHPFWLYQHDYGGTPDIDISSVTIEPVPGKRITIHYVSRIGSMNFSLTWNAVNKTLERGGDHVIFLSPKCDRLLLAQNIRLVQNCTRIDRSNARLAWYAPRKRSAFDAGEDTDVRPYMPPRTSVKDWPYDVIDYEHGPHGTPVPQPPFEAPYWGDWRWNPKRAADIDDPSETGDMAILTRFAAMNHEAMGDLSGLSYKHPAEGHEDAWNDSVGMIMLYGWSKEYEEEKQDGTHSYYSPIYWTRDGSRLEESPSVWGDERAGDALALRLTGDPAYSGGLPSLLKIKDYHNFNDDIDLSRAFDLRLYCKRFDWVAQPIVADPSHPGKYIKQGPKTRGYFNTKCWASVRQISPTPPRGV